MLCELKLPSFQEYSVRSGMTVKTDCQVMSVRSRKSKSSCKIVWIKKVKSFIKRQMEGHTSISYYFLWNTGFGGGRQHNTLLDWELCLDFQ